jgi:hypothetical protein
LPGTYGASPKQFTCELCPAGKFTPDAGNTACRNCTAGYLCVEGSSAPQPCPGGTHADQNILLSVGYLSNLTTDCIVCPVGTSCSVGSAQPTDCLPGTIAANTAQQTCSLCESGTFQQLYRQTVCEPCTPGFYCAAGSANPVLCPDGSSSNTTGATSRATCAPISAGFWAPLGSALPELCPPTGFYCPVTARDTVHGGAKPVLVPTGGAATIIVPIVEKELTLDVTCAVLNITAVKQALAEQYAVELSLIELSNPCISRRARALQGGLTLTVTIATSGSADDGKPLSAPPNLQTVMDAIDDSALGAAIGVALGSTISLSRPRHVPSPPPRWLPNCAQWASGARRASASHVSLASSTRPSTPTINPHVFGVPGTPRLLPRIPPS